jgi:hypothetical protein
MATALAMRRSCSGGPTATTSPATDLAWIGLQGRGRRGGWTVVSSSRARDRFGSLLAGCPHHRLANFSHALTVAKSCGVLRVSSVDPFLVFFFFFDGIAPFFQSAHC